MKFFTRRPARLPWISGMALAGFFASVVSAGPATTDRVSLPHSVSPEHYRIDIVPNSDALLFTGKVEIDVAVHSDVDRIVLNSMDIDIDHAELNDGTAVREIRYDPALQRATFLLDKPLKSGAYTLRLAYHGKIYQQASGLFALDYDTDRGKARALFTQFENSDARRFVPSWDEPGYKATFDVTATVPADATALSNMPVESSTALAGGLKRVHFSPTPKMSSYLLYFGMGDFERVHRDVGGVDVGVVVKRGDTADAAFALEAAAAILPYYNIYFGTPFPLPKLDLIGAPGVSQFFGAMENWGAILFFERDLLVNPRVTTERDKQSVYIAIAHEMAHQWFGDLVTMSWWDDLWLNEGFASWMENRATDQFHPEWKIWLQSQGATQAAMREDARRGTHPIITPIKDVAQASDAFDSITYLKGAAVIRMLEAYVGEDEFRTGVRNYIRAHAYGNTVTDDLWRELDKVSGRPVAQIAHEFTLQAGIPLINQVADRCVNGKAALRLTQSHFAIDADSTRARLWHVPVRLATLDGKTVSTIVFGPRPVVAQTPECADTIINAGQTGYFRSHYSEAGAAAIAAHFSSLAPSDQFGVFSDFAALAEAGQQSVVGLLDLEAHFPADCDPVVCSLMVRMLQRWNRLYDDLPTQTAFHQFARGLLNPMLVRVGWNKGVAEEDNVGVLRSRLLGALSDFDDDAVVLEARQRFSRFIADPSTLDAAARATVLAIVAVHADQATWEQLHGLARSAKTELERQELYDLLGQAEDAGLAQQALTLAVSGEPAATTTPDILSSVADRHPALAFDFTTARWEAVSAVLEPASRNRFVPGLVGDASDVRLAVKLDAFADAHIAADARQEVQKADSNIAFLARIRTRMLPQVDQWIKTR